MRKQTGLNCFSVLFLAGNVALGAEAQGWPNAAIRNAEPELHSLPAAVTLGALRGADFQPGMEAQNRPSLSESFPTNHFLSAWFIEMVKLAEANIEEQVMFVFINNATGTFNLGADEIIYLGKLGVSSGVINAMMEHDQLVNRGLIATAAPTVPVSAPRVNLPGVNEKGAKVGVARSSASTTLAALRQALQHFPDRPLESGSTMEITSSAWAGDADSIIVRSSAPEPDWAALLNPQDEAPEQPPALYQVRLPYAVKLTDPIIVFHLGRF